MNFLQSDLLTLAEIKNIVNTRNYPVEVANILYKKLIKYCIIKDNRYYELQPDITYAVCTLNIKEQVAYKVSS